MEWSFENLSWNVREIGGDGMETVVDITQPRAPRVVQVLDTPGHADRLWLDDGRVFVAAREAGLLILDDALPD